MSRDWLLGMAIVAVFIIGLGICGCSKPAEEPNQGAPSSALGHGLTKVCDSGHAIYIWEGAGSYGGVAVVSNASECQTGVAP